MSHFYPEIYAPRIQEIQKRLTREIVLEHVLFAAEFAVTPEPVPFTKRHTLSYRRICEGQTWGQTWDCGWFHLKASVPKAWAGAYVTARLDFAGEALVFDTQVTTLIGSGSIDLAQEQLNITLNPKTPGERIYCFNHASFICC